MDTELLTCVSCSTTWRRTRSRGRKPKLCFTCSEAALEPATEVDTTQVEDGEDVIPLAPEDPPPATLYNPGSRWVCQACSTKIKIGVGINEPPIHKCPKRANRVMPLTLI